MAEFLTGIENRYIAEHIGDKLADLAHELKLNPTEEAEIRQQKGSLIQAAFDVIEKWRRRGGNNATKNAMIEALTTIGAIDIVHHLQGILTGTSSTGSTVVTPLSASSGFNPKKNSGLDREPTTDEILMVAETLSQGWKSVGRRLGIKDDDLDQIERNKRDVSEMAYEMLKLWVNSKSGPTVHQLCVALDKNKLLRVAENLGYKKS